MIGALRRAPPAPPRAGLGRQRVGGGRTAAAFRSPESQERVARYPSWRRSNYRLAAAEVADGASGDELGDPVAHAHAVDGLVVVGRGWQDAVVVARQDD
jgi:hypothetical protein